MDCLKNVGSIGSGAYSEVYGNETIAYKCPIDTINSKYAHTVLREGLLLKLGYSLPMVGLCIHHQTHQFFGFAMDRAPVSFHSIQFRKIQELDSVVYWILDILEQLARLHSSGLVHGDIKPANILLSKENKAYLCDYGLATWSRNPYPDSSQDPEMYTLDYRPPELLEASIVANNLDINEKCDIWALGMSFYHCFFGPFIQMTKPDEILFFLKSMIPEDHTKRLHVIEALLKDKSKLVACLLSRMLSWNSSQRPQASELASYIKENLKALRPKCQLPEANTLKLVDKKSLILVTGSPDFKEKTLGSKLLLDMIRKTAENMCKLIQIQPRADMFMAIQSLFEILWECKVSQSSLSLAVVASLFSIYLVRESSKLPLQLAAKLAISEVQEFNTIIEKSLVFAIMYPHWSFSLFTGPFDPMIGCLSNRSDPAGPAQGDL